MPKKFSQGQTAAIDRQGQAEFKSKRRKKAKSAVNTKAPEMPPVTGGLSIGM
jgi:hypothetical protein